MRVSRDRVRTFSAQPSSRRLSAARIVAGPLLAVLIGSATLAPAVAHAQDADAGVAEGTTGRETEFVAMTGPARESVPGGVLMVSAYAVILLLLAAYVGRLALLQSSTSKELVRLDAALRARSGGEAQGKSKAEKPK